jgi:hypothetical protein
MKELREFIRYSLESGSHKSAFAEIEGKMGINGIISDLSTGGFSLVIDLKNTGDTEFDLEKYFFVRINFKKFSINAEVEKKWSLIKNEDDDKVYITGVSFKVIANDERLRLNEIIENLRSESSPHLLKNNK